MKTIKYAGLCIAVALTGGLAVTSCTDLDETIYSEVLEDNYYNNADEVMAAILRPWGHLCGTLPASQNPWYLQELTADCVAWPQKGKHGYDGGDWIRMHRHQWTATEERIHNDWHLMYMGVGMANKIISDLGKLDFKALEMPMSKEQAVGELKIYRAYLYMQLLDRYRDIPVSTSIDSLNPGTTGHKEVFNFIEKEIKDNINNLSEDKTSTYGRVNKWGAYALLARLYLNAEVYSGTPRWDDCIAACDNLAKSGYALDAAWNDPFKVDNDKNSRENIWIIVFDHIYAKGNSWYVQWLHYAHQTGWNLQNGPINALVAQPSFYSSFADNDKRKTEGFLIGTQYPRKTNADGVVYFDTIAGPLLGSEEYNGQPLVFVNEIESMEKGEENSGARSIKYEILEQSTQDMDNDWPLFRYAEMYFNKAEALMRKNNGVATQEAVDLINTVKQRAFAPETWDKAKYTTSTLTMDEILAERGREFAFEGFRRSDLVRFDKFVTTDWWDLKASNNKAYNIFPIPNKALSANKNLKPNEANALF